jgi:cytochrome c oxidase cbb3-type subunit 4
MDTSIFHSAWTVLAMGSFIALVIWAWSGKRQKNFEEASRLPLEDDLPVIEKADAEGEAK